MLAGTRPSSGSGSAKKIHRMRTVAIGTLDLRSAADHIRIRDIVMGIPIRSGAGYHGFCAGKEELNVLSRRAIMAPKRELFFSVGNGCTRHRPREEGRVLSVPP